MDKQLLWQVLGYVFSVVAYFVLSWRYKGKEEATNEVRNEVMKQELAIQGKGLGELNLRIFINENTIEAVVKELQPLFKKLKEGKNGKE